MVWTLILPIVFAALIGYVQGRIDRSRDTMRLIVSHRKVSEHNRRAASILRGVESLAIEGRWREGTIEDYGRVIHLIQHARKALFGRTCAVCNREDQG